MIEKGSDIIALRSPEGKLTYVSPSVPLALGYSKDELLNMPGFELVHPDDLPGLIIQTQRIAQKPGSFYKRQQRFRHKSGNWVWGEGTVTNLLDEPGINAFVANFKDISEKKREEQYREFDKSNLDALINNTMDLMWSVDTNFNLITSNKPFDEMLTLISGSKLSKGSNALNLGLPKEQLKRFKTYYERAFAGETFTEIEHSDSPFEIWSEISFYPIRNGDEIVGTACHSRNITEKKKAEDKLIATTNELKHALNDLNKIMEYSLDVICVVDKENHFVNVSAACETVWGYTPDELIGKSLFDFVYPEDHEKTRNTAHNVMTGINTTHFENRYVRKDGSLVDISWSVRWNKKDKVRYGIARDITEKKRLEKTVAKERKRFYDLFLEAPSSMGVLSGPNHMFEIANPPYLQLIGKKDIIGKTVKEVLPEVVDQGFINMLDAVYKTGISFSANEALIKLDIQGNGILVDRYLNFLYQAHKTNDDIIDGILFFAVDVTDQVLLRKKIEESEARLKEAQAISHTGNWELFFENNVALWSDEACRIYGLSPDDNMHSFEDWLSYVHPEDLNSVMKIIDESQKTFSESDINHRIILKDGTVKHIYSKSKFIFDKEGKPIGLYGIAMDVTEDKIIENKLKESEAHLVEAQKLAKMGSWNFDFKTDKLTWSDELYNVFDTDKQTFNETHGSFIHLIDEADRDLVLQTSKHTQLTGEPFTVEYGITTSKGEKRIIKEHGYGEKDEEGNIIRLFGTAQDVTKQKRAEEELQKLATIVHHSSEFIGIAAPDSKIIYVNAGGKKMVSLNRDIQSTKLFDFFAPHDLDIFQTIILPTLAEKGRWVGEMYLRNFETGERIPVQADIFYVYSPNSNKPIAIATVSTDISERKKNQEKLELQNAELTKTNAELDRFVYSVSHDLRSPLTSILGLLSFIEKESNEPHVLQYAGMIKTSIKRQDEFIKNILSYSQNNRAEIKIERIEVQKNLDEIVDALRTIKNTEGIDIEVEINEKKPFYSDKLRFNIVMENLISNAIKYHKKDIPGRYIKVKGNSDNDNLYVSIEDNGVGIAPEYHTKIFDMFFRLSSFATGSGIGLYIVKETIAKLHGTIEISSEKDRGTTFYIVLKNLKP